LQSLFFSAWLAQVELDGLVQELIDGAPFDFAQVLQGGAFFRFNSQSERDPSHVCRLHPTETDVNIDF
jgi:hypothetical protein